MAASDRETIETFHELVNMTPHELETWLHGEASKSVGWVNEDATESVGHESGRHIVRILHKHRDAYSDDDVAHMQKVVGYIKRHLAQGGPQHDKADSRWASSLKNWGHDPMKASRGSRRPAEA